jgi:hypothetical protein
LDINYVYEIKVMFGEISLKLRQMNWNVARNNVSVVADKIPNQMTIYTCLIIDIWTRWRQRTSMRFYTPWCHLPKMLGFQWNWHQKFLTLLRTPLARRNALSESMQCTQFRAKSAKNAIISAKSVKNDLISQWIF